VRCRSLERDPSFWLDAAVRFALLAGRPTSSSAAKRAVSRSGPSPCAHLGCTRRGVGCDSDDEFGGRRERASYAMMRGMGSTQHSSHHPARLSTAAARRAFTQAAAEGSTPPDQ